MSNDIAISVENLAKAYRIGLKEEQHETFLGACAAFVRSPFENFRSVRNLSRFDDALGDGPGCSDTIWALKDVSFEVKRGEAVGIIGRNGAGKSTLLKILSRITEPTSGKAQIYGRVGSLLEVGTGFHPDLTGRENVYLNGTILGMKKREIDAKFEEIVDFSGIEKFIDTPVKRYSSGMRIRLAFSVAAHLEPEILMVDEVLAVGDAEFQKKCLGKMEDVANQGRTVLFVSHNMGAIQTLCTSCLLLRGGTSVLQGNTLDVIGSYVSDGTESRWVRTQASRKGQPIVINTVEAGCHGRAGKDSGPDVSPVQIAIEYTVVQPVKNVLLGIDVFSPEGVPLFRTYDLLGFGMGVREAGTYKSIVSLPSKLFVPATYFVEIICGIHRESWISRGEIRLQISVSRPADSDVDYPGLVRVQGDWEVCQLSA